MFFVSLLLFPILLFAQELELSTRNIHAYAQVKNCVDFTMCSPYEENLKKSEGVYRWKVKFSQPISKVLEAMKDCRVEYSDFNLILRDENSLVIRDFKLMYGRKYNELQRKYVPMELKADAFLGLKKKEPFMDTLLRSGEPLLAMKSAVFEFEYGLEDYSLMAEPLQPNVLGRTHHGLKIVSYDPEKWDEKVCRFYEVMRHEVQHVKNNREVTSCKGNHHFVKGHNDDINVYVNDLSFIRKYCPEDAELYQNVESVLFAMYENRQTTIGCSLEGGPHQPGPLKTSGKGKAPEATLKQSPKGLGQATTSKTGGILNYLKRNSFIKNFGEAWKSQKRPSNNDSQSNAGLH